MLGWRVVVSWCGVVVWWCGVVVWCSGVVSGSCCALTLAAALGVWSPVVAVLV